MSSFRIERQYVSFKTLETPNVHPVEEDRQDKEEWCILGDNGSEDGPVLQMECAAVIIEKAEKKAECIRLRAEKESTAVLGSAKARAEEIISEADKNAEKIRETARAEGYAAGIKEASAEAEARKRTEAESLWKMEEKLRSDYSGLVDGMRKDFKSLIIEITKKIINVKLKESDEVFIGLINDAIDRLKQTGYLIVRVCPEDYIRYFGDDFPENDLNAGEAKVAVIEEEGFSSGDLVVESEREVLNLSINRQIRQIEEAFSE
ncbi:MAG: hypothetical protein EOM54_02190 [Clostridia bacterium]|nr:hypothetical protein [Clostridia bacterium]NCC68890.1 hypothetical protein [Clostridia bacterium]